MGLWLIKQPKTTVKLQDTIDKHKQQKISQSIITKYKCEIEARALKARQEELAKQAAISKAELKIERRGYSSSICSTKP